jgi:hypothetical protein
MSRRNRCPDCRVGLQKKPWAAEISLFTEQTPPNTVVSWFTLLQNNRLLGLSLLNGFDIVDYALVDLMFLALYFALR